MIQHYCKYWEIVSYTNNRQDFADLMDIKHEGIGGGNKNKRRCLLVNVIYIV